MGFEYIEKIYRLASLKISTGYKCQDKVVLVLGKVVNIGETKTVKYPSTVGVESTQYFSEQRCFYKAEGGGVFEPPLQLGEDMIYSDQWKKERKELK